MARRKGIDWDAQPLGKVPDADLASAIGASIHAVAQARWRRGIAPVHDAAERSRLSAIRRGAVDWDKQPLGAETDAATARRLGVGKRAAQNARVTRGIPRARPSCGALCPCGAQMGGVLVGQPRRFCSSTCRATAGESRRRGTPEPLIDAAVALAALNRTLREKT